MPALQTSTVLNIELNGTNGHDRLQHFGSSLNLGNAQLSVSLMTPPTNGEHYTIVTQFISAALSGRFAQGTSLVVSGQLFAIAYLDHSVRLIAASNAPSWTTLAPQGGFTNLVISGSNGYPFATYTIATTTNVLLPPHLWPVVKTNTFTEAGFFSFSQAPAEDESTRFFHLRMP